MGVSFVCPNCSKLVDPISSNATMSGATKRWQHKDCAIEPPRKEPPGERRRKPRRA